MIALIKSGKYSVEVAWVFQNHKEYGKEYGRLAQPDLLISDLKQAMKKLKGFPSLSKSEGIEFLRNTMDRKEGGLWSKTLSDGMVAVMIQDGEGFSETMDGYLKSNFRISGVDAHDLSFDSAGRLYVMLRSEKGDSEDT